MFIIVVLVFGTGEALDLFVYFYRDRACTLRCRALSIVICWVATQIWGQDVSPSPPTLVVSASLWVAFRAWLHPDRRLRRLSAGGGPSLDGGDCSSVGRRGQVWVLDALGIGRSGGVVL